jgi:hypothetical protein
VAVIITILQEGVVVMGVETVGALTTAQRPVVVAEVQRRTELHSELQELIAVTVM